MKPSDCNLSSETNITHQGDDVDGIDKLRWIMRCLRDPEHGCPWDLKQNFKSIVSHTLEEAYEVADAIENEDYPELKLELGDLLFQVVFYSQLGEEKALFDFDGVVDGVCEKLIRRHPHVFAENDFADEAAIKANWELEKAKERQSKSAQSEMISALDDIPLAMPALSRASKIQKRAANVGFDWTDINDVLAKVKEEVDELQVEIDAGEKDKATEELGDLMFAMVNLARHLKADPETVLRQANQKFERRFRGVEKLASAKNIDMREESLPVLDDLWDQIKASEKNN